MKLALVLCGVLLMAAACGGDPNLEGAKLDLRNKDYARALENVEAALQTNPQNAEAYYVKGQVLQEQASETQDAEQHTKMVQDMAEAYQRAIELDPALTEDVNNRLRLAYFNEFQRGGQAFNRGQEDSAGYAEAASYFRNATLLQPDSADAYINYGYSLINAGRSEEAIQPLHTATEKGSVNEDVYILLSDLYIRANRSAEAVTLLEKAQAEYPENDEIRSQLLNAYVASGQEDRALDQYRQAVESDPNSKLFRYNYGSLLLQSERYDEAIEQLEAAIAIDPNYASAHYNLGAAYVNKAVDANDRIGELDDELRQQRATLTAAQVQQRESEMDALVAQRRQNFEAAVAPLERARDLMEAEGGEVMPVCQALFQAYVQTGQQAKAETVSACAGYGAMNNQ